MKKTLLLIFLSIFSFSAINAEVTWELKDGTLTIEGTGDMTMPDYEESVSPWYSQQNEIKNVVIKNGVKNIGIYAFLDCVNLTSITIPNSVTSIGHAVFLNCGSLTSITIPNSVTSIGEYVFSGCNNLASIIVENGNVAYDSRNNCNAIIETKSNTLIAGCKSTIIPNTVTNIGDCAFYGCEALTSITIPNSVANIGDRAFYGCKGLTSVTISNSVTNIGNYAFYGCEALTLVTIPNSVTNIGNFAFGYCRNLRNTIIYGNNDLKIGSSVFGECKELQCIALFCETLPKSTENLGVDYNDVYLFVPTEVLYERSKTYPWSQFPADNVFEYTYLTDGKEYTGNKYFSEVQVYYTRDFQNTEWQALYIPFSMKYDDWKNDFDVAYINGIRQFDTDDDGQIDETWMDVIKIKEGYTKPNCPYVIRAKSTGMKILDSRDDCIYPAYELGISCSTTTTKYTFTGTYKNISADDIYYNNYYGMSSGELVLGDGEHGLKPYRWYMNAETIDAPYISGEPTRAKSIKINVVGEESETTGIKEVRKSPVKDSSVYDLNGRKVNEKSLKSGLYIKNGKKFIIK